MHFVGPFQRRFQILHKMLQSKYIRCSIGEKNLGNRGISRRYQKRGSMSLLHVRSFVFQKIDFWATTWSEDAQNIFLESLEVILHESEKILNFWQVFGITSVSQVFFPNRAPYIFWLKHFMKNLKTALERPNEVHFAHILWRSHILIK